MWHFVSMLFVQVVRTQTTAMSGPAIALLYGIIAPSHDFTKYNRERASSGVAVRQQHNNGTIPLIHMYHYHSRIGSILGVS